MSSITNLCNSHKINKVAKLLNMSHEAIRFYEEKGIISPRRDSENQYRLYGDWDVQVLLNARMYRQLGFSLEQTSELLNNFDLEKYKDFLTDREDEIYQEIKKLQNLRKLAESTRIDLSRAASMIDLFTIQTRPQMYRINLDILYDYNNTIVGQDWTESMPFIFQSAVFNQHSKVEKDKAANLYLNKASFDFYHKIGFCIEKKYADFLKIEENQHITYYPECRSIFTVIKSNSVDGYCLDNMDPIFEYFDQYNLEVSGDIITKNLYFKKQDDHYVNYSQVWVPF